MGVHSRTTFTTAKNIRRAKGSRLNPDLLSYLHSVLTILAICMSSLESVLAQSCVKPFTSLMKWWAFSIPSFQKFLLLINIKIYAAAIAINAAINQDELEKGMLYPDITRIREVSVTVARQVIRQAQKQKLDGEKSIRSLTDSQMDAWIKERMYDPSSQNNRTEQQPVSKL